MNKLLLCILACLHLTAIDSYAIAPTKIMNSVKGKVAAWFYQQEEVIKQEIKYTSQHRLAIDNLNGNIHVKTWKQDGIILKMVKRAHSLEDLQKIAISIDASDKDSLFIKTKAPSNAKNNCGVDYELLIPHKFALRLATGHGNIKVRQCEGAIQATTDEGAIELLQSGGKINVTANNSGAITIKQAKGPIQAMTNDGPIILEDIRNAVTATATNGSINLSACVILPQSSVRLTASGAVIIKLPHDTNAHVLANSDHGRVISEHLITMDPCATKLNNHAWQELKHKINGSIGTGSATIVLNAHNGPIKILETEKKA